ncbi:Uncharacterised protein [Mycobacterium tuberculosis]|nr:Uncharacterised protein [Mycobacterium tuberculosis]
MALAASLSYTLGLFTVWPPKKAAVFEPLELTMAMKPRSLSSFSRRSVMVTSVGGFSAMSPSSVL